MKHIYLFDIDGTLYSNRFHEIDPGLLDELKALQEEESLIYLVSSRSPFEMQHLPGKFLEYPFDGMILEGGAALYDENKRLIDARLISGTDVKAIRNYCRDHDLLWRYSGPDGNYFNTKEPDEVRHHWRKLYLITPEVKNWVGDDVCNILIWTGDDTHRKEIQELLPKCSMVIYDHCIEIRAKGVSKEKTLSRIRENHASSQIISFGDGPNDIEMLKNADYGIAMGNAPEEVKAAADEVIGPVSEGSVSAWLKTQRLRSGKNRVLK